jgi:endonuclease G
MKKRWLVILFLGAFVLAAYSFCSIDSTKNSRMERVSSNALPPDSINPDALEIPLMKGNIPVIKHLGYAFQYSEKHEQAFWVGYELTKKETEKAFERTDDFIPDPAVSTGTATVGDYAKSGYDRGHLAPAADMGWSQQAMAESFYFSNMSPQVPGFNRGIWKMLEEQVRTWAKAYDSIYVVTGPVLKDGLVQMGPNGVSIPKYYYKVILDNTGGDAKAIGFLMPNEASKEPLENFAVSVDQVEQETGIDFFNKLPDSRENAFEKEVCIPCWTWKIINSPSPNPSTPTQPGSLQTQCNGITKAGAQCSRMTTDADGFCYQHKP